MPSHSDGRLKDPKFCFSCRLSEVLLSLEGRPEVRSRYPEPGLLGQLNMRHACGSLRPLVGFMVDGRSRVQSILAVFQLDLIDCWQSASTGALHSVAELLKGHLAVIGGVLNFVLSEVAVQYIPSCTDVLPNQT